MPVSLPWDRVSSIAIPVLLVAGLLVYLLVRRSRHKSAVLVTLAILLLFSGDTPKRINLFYQALFSPATADPAIDHSFPLTNVLLSIAVGVLLYFFVAFVLHKLSEIPPTGEDSAPTTLLNTLILSVLALSFFLVISVFITIPYLSDLSKPSVYTPQMLESTLDTISSQRPLAFEPLPTPPRPFAPDSSVREVPRGALRVPGFEERRRQIADQSAGRDKAATALETFSSSYRQNEMLTMQKLVRDFESASENIRRNKTDLFGKAVDGFVLYRKKALDAYNQAWFMTRRADVEDGGQIMQFYGKMHSVADEGGRIDSFLEAWPAFSFIPYPDSVAFQNTVAAIQVSSHDGSEWGIFGLMSQYLINTESSELVLLIGMLGFGLLGASLSSFEAAETRRNMFETFRSKPLVTNFGYVLMRGGGAAIAVYLCTKAGLSIFSLGSDATTATSGSYMLLLTCFIASIYSDKVWTVLSSTLTPGSKTAGTATTGNAAPAAVIPPPANGMAKGLAPPAADLPDVSDSGRIDRPLPGDTPAHPAPVTVTDPS